MPVNITVDQAAKWAAEKWINYKEPQSTQERKVEILSATKRNVVRTAFNISSVLLVVAVASAVLFAHTAALVFGSIGLFARFTTEKELKKYHLPKEIPPPVKKLATADSTPSQAAPSSSSSSAQAPNKEVVAQRYHEKLRDAVLTGRLVRHALDQISQSEKEENIFKNVGLEKPKEWHEDEVSIFGFSVWKNNVPIPPAASTAVVSAGSTAVADDSASSV